MSNTVVQWFALIQEGWTLDYEIEGLSVWSLRVLSALKVRLTATLPILLLLPCHSFGEEVMNSWNSTPTLTSTVMGPDGAGHKVPSNSSIGSIFQSLNFFQLGFIESERENPTSQPQNTQNTKYKTHNSLTRGSIHRKIIKQWRWACFKIHQQCPVSFPCTLGLCPIICNSGWGRSLV